MRTTILTTLAAMLTLTVPGAELFVAPSGAPYTSIQDALDDAGAGDTVTVRAGTYYERLYPPGGSAGGGFLTLRAYPGERVLLCGDNRHSSGDPHMIYIADASYIRIAGLHICSNRATSADGGSGIFIEGAGSHIAIVSNVIYHMLGTHGMGITVYGTSGTAISDLLLAWNTISNCEPATSEALTLNGNVRNFAVISNTVVDVNNIGIDFIGGETDINPSQGARHGLCTGNRVIRARSSYGGGFAAGIYVDGGTDIVIERNVVSECDMGIELGAENAGWDTTGIVVRSNLVYGNDKVGIVFGGYDAGVGRVRSCAIINNTIAMNNGLGLTGGDFHGEIIVQYATGNAIPNNLVIVDTHGDRRALSEEAAAGNVDNRFDYNLYYCAGFTPVFQFGGAAYNGFASYTNASGSDAHGMALNPEVVDAAAHDFHLTDASPAVNGGDPAPGQAYGELDSGGDPRVMFGRVDIGAYEYVPEPATVLVSWLMVGCVARRRRSGGAAQ